MTDKSEDSKFVDSLAEALEAETQALPDATAQRLQQLRREAVMLSESGRRPLFRGPVPALIATAAVIALALLVSFRMAPSVPALPVSSEAEFALAQDLELFEQLEFLAWLDEAHLDAG